MNLKTLLKLNVSKMFPIVPIVSKKPSPIPGIVVFVVKCVQTNLMIADILSLNM